MAISAAQMNAVARAGYKVTSSRHGVTNLHHQGRFIGYLVAQDADGRFDPPKVEVPHRTIIGQILFRVAEAS